MAITGTEKSIIPPRTDLGHPAVNGSQGTAISTGPGALGASGYSGLVPLAPSPVPSNVYSLAPTGSPLTPEAAREAAIRIGAAAANAYSFPVRYAVDRLIAEMLKSGYQEAQALRQRIEQEHGIEEKAALKSAAEANKQADHIDDGAIITAATTAATVVASVDAARDNFKTTGAADTLKNKAQQAGDKAGALDKAVGDMGGQTGELNAQINDKIAKADALDKQAGGFENAYLDGEAGGLRVEAANARTEANGMGQQVEVLKDKTNKATQEAENLRRQAPQDLAAAREVEKRAERDNRQKDAGIKALEGGGNLLAAGKKADEKRDEAAVKQDEAIEAVAAKIAGRLEADLKGVLDGMIEYLRLAKDKGDQKAAEVAMKA